MRDMKRHRFIGAFDLSQTEFRLTDKELVHQIAKVLRLESGEQIVLCDGRGREVLVELREVANNAIVASATEKSRQTPEPSRDVILYCAILKRENFEIVVQKATEVGVAEIVPMLTRRTVKQNVKVERLREIAKEAAEQSGRGTVPAVHEPMGFEEAVEQAKKNDENLFFDVDGTSGSVKIAAGRVGLFIGPEGGWDPEERAAAKKAGFVISSLGPLVLRGETAAIVASYLACQA